MTLFQTQHLRGPTGVFSLVLLLTAAGGCRVFDGSLYKANGDAGASETTDGPIISPTDLGKGPGVTVSLGERCDLPSPNIMSSAMLFSIDTRGMKDDVRDLACLPGSEYRGPDGVVAVDMKEGEKWHIHANTDSPTTDPAIYILAGCDTRSCQRGMGIDDCGAGKAEHLSFVAPRTQTYFVGFDSREPAGAGPFDVIITRPVCGSGGAPEHSETCDDGNVVSGDGCDKLCRKEMAEGSDKELEPNDDPRAANVFPPGASAATAAGTLATACDVDMYAVKIKAGGTIIANVQRVSGLACAPGGPTMRLDLLNNDGASLGEGEAASGEGCPSLDERHAFAKGLDAGEYFLRLQMKQNLPLEYRLRVQTP